MRRTVVKHFKTIAQRTRVADARFHDLWHSFVVTSLKAGDDIKTVQSNLGHATVAFMLDVYGHGSEKMQRNSAPRMQQLYESIKQNDDKPISENTIRSFLIMPEIKLLGRKILKNAKENSQ